MLIIGSFIIALSEGIYTFIMNKASRMREYRECGVVVFKPKYYKEICCSDACQSALDSKAWIFMEACMQLLSRKKWVGEYADTESNGHRVKLRILTNLEQHFIDEYKKNPRRAYIYAKSLMDNNKYGKSLV